VFSFEQRKNHFLNREHKPMKGPSVSLKHLQRALTMELTTINTYLYQERQLDDWGIDRLAARMREETDEERTHASLFLTRLLFLEGEPDV
jgi:bacterioferritin